MDNLEWSAGCGYFVSVYPIAPMSGLKRLFHRSTGASANIATDGSNATVNGYMTFLLYR